MFSLLKPDFAVALVAALVPLAAQARPRDLGTTGYAIHAVESHRNSAFLARSGTGRAHYADNAASFQSRGTVPNDAYAINEVPVKVRAVADGASGSDIT